jgi:hypothetical protein
VNVHLTLTPQEAEELAAGRVADSLKPKVTAAIGEAERLEQAMESARKLDQEGKLIPVDLSQHPRRDDQLRVVYRQPSDEELRCTTFIPLPDSPDLRAALAAAVPAFTAYTYQEAERLVQGER